MQEYKNAAQYDLHGQNCKSTEVINIVSI